MERELDYWRAETVAFLALQSLHGVGFRTLYKIAAQNISFKEIIKSEDTDFFEKTLKFRLDSSVKESEENWMVFKLELWNKGIDLARMCTKNNIRILFFNQNIFPDQLKNMNEPPLWLFVEGDPMVLREPSIAIVGSRKATEDGLWLTKYIVAAISNKGINTVSGLADGIDQKAHYESLRFNIPTIAVLGTGIDSNYPRGSEQLRSEIVTNGGVVISEYLIGQSYSAQNFVRRNRIQAALAQITIPIEWNIKSGTAHTVKFTKDYERYLLMPYLHDSDIETIEIQTINSYKRGVVFKVPDQNQELIKFIQEPSEKELLPLKSDQGQISLEL